MRGKLEISDSRLVCSVPDMSTEIIKDGQLRALVYIWRAGNQVRHGRFINLGFEIGGLIEKTRRNIGVAGCLGELQQRHRLTREILSTDHGNFPRTLTLSRIHHAQVGDSFQPFV